MADSRPAPNPDPRDDPARSDRWPDAVLARPDSGSCPDDDPAGEHAPYCPCPMGGDPVLR